MTQRFCGDCGQQLDNSRFCPNCGTPIPANGGSAREPSIPANNPPSPVPGGARRGRPAALIGAGVVLLLVVAWAVVGRSGGGQTEAAALPPEAQEEIGDVAAAAEDRLDDGMPNTADERRYVSTFEVTRYRAQFEAQLGQVPSGRDALFAGYATCVNVERAGSWDPIVEASLRQGGGSTPAAALRLWMLDTARTYLCDPFPISDVNRVRLALVGAHLPGVDLTYELFTGTDPEMWLTYVDMFCSLPTLDVMAEAVAEDQRPPFSVEELKAGVSAVRYEFCEGGYRQGQ